MDVVKGVRQQLGTASQVGNVISTKRECRFRQTFFELGSVHSILVSVHGARPAFVAVARARNAKYNQLIRIAEELGESAVYGGTTWTR